MNGTHDGAFNIRSVALVASEINPRARVIHDEPLMTQTRIPVWSWRDAIRQAPIPPLTKLVCYSLANYLSDAGEGCYPSIERLMDDTGLSNKSLSTHLANAVEAGLVHIERDARSGGRLGRNRYLPQFPASCDLARTPAAMHNTHDEASDDDGSLHHVKEIHVDEIHHVNLLPPPRVGESLHHVKEIHINKYPVELSSEVSTPPLPPAGGRVRVRDATRKNEIDQILADVSTPERQRLIDRLFDPLLRRRRFQAPDVPFAIRQLADWPKLRDLDDAALAEVLEAILAARAAVVKDHDVQLAVDEVSPASVERQKAAEIRARNEARASPELLRLWDRMREWLAGVHGDGVMRASFDLLLVLGSKQGRNGRVLVLGARSPFAAEYVTRNFSHYLESAARHASPEFEGVEVVAERREVAA